MRYEPGPRPSKRRRQSSADTPGSIAARERFEAAMAALEAELAGIVVHVCLVDQPVSSWGPLNGHPVRVGILRLRDGLDALSNHYAAARFAA
jgi:hypothetical protein